jgi:HK97 family phage major capsid protein
MKQPSGSIPLIQKQTLLSEARLLLARDKFSHEDSARVSGLLALAGHLGPHGGEERSAAKPEMRKFSRALRSLAVSGGANELRDMGISSGGPAGAYLVPQDFADKLWFALKAYDRIFDPDVSNIVPTDSGAPIMLAALDDTLATASVVSEGQPSTEQDPSPGASQVALPSAPTWRSGLVKLSVELLQDSRFDPADFLAQAFAVRFARGVGASLVSTLLASAKVGRTATGDSNSGGTGANSIGYQDLIALRTSVDAAYRASGKVWWVMSDNTLAALDNLLDKNGRPIFDASELDSDGNRVLLGYPLAICPSMPPVASGQTPVAFGASGYFTIRVVPSVTAFKPITERWAEYLQIGFVGFMRCHGALLCATGADSPVKLLKNA